MPKKKDDVIIKPNKLIVEPFKKVKMVTPLPEKKKENK